MPLVSGGREGKKEAINIYFKEKSETNNAKLATISSANYQTMMKFFEAIPCGSK